MPQDTTVANVAKAPAAPSDKISNLAFQFALHSEPPSRPRNMLITHLLISNVTRNMLSTYLSTSHTFLKKQTQYHVLSIKNKFKTRSAAFVI